MKPSKVFKEGYEKGRLAEAEITLGNMYIILDEMTEQPHERNHILTCIRDLEKATGMTRKDFDDDVFAEEDINE